MKNILIIAATEFEFADLDSLILHKSNHQLQYLTTGVGMLSTTFRLTKWLLQNPVDMVFQIGIAGCFNTKIPLGEVVAVDKEFIGDLGVEENVIWKDMFDVGFIDTNELPFTNKGIENKNTHTFNLQNIQLATAITVNEITTQQHRIKAIQQAYAPTLESMEGAALHYVCNSLQIPYLQIRGVSNYVGERDKSKWEIKKAIEASKQALKQIIDSL